MSENHNQIKDERMQEADTVLSSRKARAFLTGAFRALKEQVNIFPLAGVCILSFYVLGVSKANLLKLEDAQTLVFPAMVFLVWLTPKPVTRRLPGYFIFITIFLWAISGLYVRGYFAFVETVPTVTLASLSGDPYAVKSLEKIRAYEKYAAGYGAPKMTAISREFKSSSKASQWLERAPSSRLLIYGNSDWVNLAAPDRQVRKMADGLSKSMAEWPDQGIAEWLLNRAQQLNLDLGQEVAILSVKGSDYPLLIALAPQFQAMPFAPDSLVNQFVIFASLALEQLNNYPKDESAINGFRAYMLKASSTIGAWRSIGHLGWARYFAGVADLIQGAASNEEAGFLNCALSEFLSAGAKAISQESPETNAAIVNNAVVTQILLGEETKFPSLEDFLVRAANIRTKNGEIPRSSKVAVLNLMILDRVGYWR